MNRRLRPSPSHSPIQSVSTLASSTRPLSIRSPCARPVPPLGIAGGPACRELRRFRLLGAWRAGGKSYPGNGKVYPAPAGAGSARALGQFVHQKVRLVGQGECALDVLRLESLAGLVEEALNGLQAVLLTGRELRGVDLTQSLLGAVDALLGLGAELLLIHSAQHGRQHRRRRGGGDRRRRRRRRAGTRRPESGRRRAWWARGGRARLRRWRGSPRTLLRLLGLGGRRRRREPALDRRAAREAQARRDNEQRESHPAPLNGSLIVMVVPRPSSLRTSMEPSCI